MEILKYPEETSVTKNNVTVSYSAFLKSILRLKSFIMGFGCLPDVFLFLLEWYLLGVNSEGDGQHQVTRISIQPSDSQQRSSHPNQPQQSHSAP